MSTYRIEWIRAKNPYATKGSDYHEFYNEYQKEYGPVGFDSYKRYCREAVLLSTPLPEKEGETKVVSIERDQVKNTLYYEVRSSKLRTIDDLIAYAEIDMNEWECTKQIANAWGSDTNENFQIKGWFAKRKPGDLTPQEYASRFHALLEGYEPKVVPKKDYAKPDGMLVELALFDHHFGQLTWGAEVGQDYDIKIASKLYEKTIDYFIQTTKDFVGKWLLVIGNDFFNSDNAVNTTFAGTPQAEDTRWQKTFTSAEKLVIEQIDKLKEYAPVDVVVVPGNHDKSRIFYFGEFLSAWYRKDENVKVDNTPKKHKFYAWEKNLILFTHGDGLHPGAMPLFMAQEEPLLFAKAKYREIHKGHFHSASEKKYQLSKHTQGIAEVVLPSLTTRDDWHTEKGYQSQRESMAIVWTPNCGRFACFYYHPEE